MWEGLRELRSDNLGSPWCLAGDFNAVRSVSERRGSAVHIATTVMVEFDDFIEDMGLNDLPLVGRKYTWHRMDGSSMSRIDRFLLSDEWLGRWSDLSQWGLARSVPDHCPIILKSTVKNWGPKPFRVLNCWADNKDFDLLVKGKWG